MSENGYLLPYADIQWQASGRPYSPLYEDIFCDSQDGPAEKNHVFIQGNHLPQKWEQLPSTPGHFCIVESGFGFGLSFLQTLKFWQKHGNSNWHLHYIAIEKHPVRTEDIMRFYRNSHQDPSHLLEQYPLPAPGFHRLYFDGNVHLTLIFDDIVNVLPSLEARVDAWFLDGFKPSTNADIWSRTLFSAIRTLSRPGASFATYSTAGVVRQNAMDEGLQISKQKGFGRKAEMLQGQVQGSWSPNYRVDSYKNNKRITVVGGGIAGLCLVRQLKQRGIDCCLIEQAGPMSGASSIRQLSASPQLAKRPDAYSRFSLNAFLFMLNNFAGVMRQSGIHRLPVNEAEQEKFLQICKYFNSNIELDTELNAELDKGSAQPFIQQRMGGIFYNAAGWVASEALASMLTDLVKPVSASIAEIKKHNNSWQLFDTEGHHLHDSDHVIVATGSGSTSLKVLDQVPLMSVKGHSLAITGEQGPINIEHILSGEISLLPPLNGLNTLSASYEPNADPLNMEVDQDEVKMLLEKLAKDTERANAAASSEIQNLTPAGINPKVHAAQVAFRCTPRDRLPLVDGLPDWKLLQQYCRPLRRDASWEQSVFQDYQEGLWVNSGFGSHGMTHIPLCSEYLVSRILEEPWPISRETALSFSAIRFAVRDAKKQTTGD